jgi:Gpi18-like mannosyltransferase
MNQPRSLQYIILLGILIRLFFLPVKGFEQDFLFFSSCAQAVENGVTTCYDNVEVIEGHILNYPPVYLYLLGLAAHVYHAFTSAPLQTTAFLCLLKGITIFFEVLICVMLFRWVSAHRGEKQGLLAAGLFFLNPAVFYVSVVFGQVDAIFGFFLLMAVIACIENRAFWCGAFLAASLLMKIMTLPFIPFFFLVFPAKREWKRTGWMIAGFAAATLLILSPYLFTGRLGLVYQRCFKESVEWGGSLTIGAFNLWVFHIQPMLFDERNWGWLFGSDGMLTTNGLLALLTYKKLGMGLFGLAYLLCLRDLATRKERFEKLVPLAHIAIAFFLLPTRMHERYLFPFFVFFAPLICTTRTRQWLFCGFSLTYLLNLIQVCPPLGPIPAQADLYTAWSLCIAGANLVLYAIFIGTEYCAPSDTNRHAAYRAAYSALAGFLLVLGLTGLRGASHPDPDKLYLSHLAPVSIQQDWPIVPPENILRPDLSTDGNQLQIGHTVYRYGIGVHANSRIEYDIPGTHNFFEAYIGVDAEIIPSLRHKTPASGTVVFSVLINGEKRYESPLMLATTPPTYISFRLPEGQEHNRLTLLVHGTENGIDSDHANWGLARVWLTHPR